MSLRTPLLLTLWTFAAAGAEWRFSDGAEFPGAKGHLRDAGAEIELHGDFSGGGYYVGAYRDFKPPAPTGAIRLRVRGPASGLELRLIDAEGQCHQFHLELDGAAHRHQDIAFPVGRRSERHWGGPADGVIRQPLRSVGLVLRARDLKKGATAGTLVFRDFGIAPPAPFRTAALGADARDWRLDNGAEFPGARGALTGEAGRLRLEADFSGGGAYVSANHRPPKPVAAETFGFTLNGPLRRVGVRFRDSAGQVHQHFRDLRPDGEQALSFPVVGSPKSRWGGPADGVLRPPVEEFMIVVHAGDLAGPAAAAKKGIIELSAIRIGGDAPLSEWVAWRVPAPERLFRRPEDASPVTLAAAMPSDVDDDAFRYVYRDYGGETVADGAARFDPATGLLEAPPPPGRGFFELEYPALGIRAGVAVDTPPPAVPDPWFGVDTSLSWGRGPDNYEGFRAYLRILRENGVVWARDRLDWRRIEPERGDFRFDNRFGELRRAAADEGVNVLDVFHDAPTWTGAANRGGNRPDELVYPKDLFGAADGLAGMAENWRGSVRALEVWNEPEFSGNGFPPEYVIALTKAVSRRFAERGLDTTVVGGVITTPRPDTGYYETFVASGLLDDCDAMSFHSYSDTPVMEGLVDYLRAIEAKYASPRAGIPIWITETGKPWKRGATRASVAGDRRSAREIAAKAAEMRALGLAKFFAFSFKYYDELHNNFGMMDANHTPMRSMAAYARAVRLLSHRDYVGDLRDSGATRARVFRGAEGMLAVLYTGDDARTLTLPPGLSVARAEGADGRPLTIKDGRLVADDGLAYLHLPADLPERFLDRETNAMRLTRIARAYVPAPRAAKPLLLQPATDAGPLLPTIFGFYAPDHASVQLRVKANNFDAGERSFVPELALPEGARLLEAPPAAVAIPPRESREIVFRVALDPDAETKGPFWGLTVSDRDGQATPLRFSLKPYRRETVKAGGPERDGEWRDISGGANWSTWPGGGETPNIEAAFRFRHAPDALVLQVRVRDAAHHNAYSAPEAWRGDSVQFTLQALGDADASGTGTWCEITAAACADGAILYRHRGGEKPGLLSRSRLEFSEPAKGQYLYEIIVDREELGLDAAATRFGAALVVNSNSGNGRDGYLAWGRGIAEGAKTDALFNRVELE